MKVLGLAIAALFISLPAPATAVAQETDFPICTSTTPSPPPPMLSTPWGRLLQLADVPKVEPPEYRFGYWGYRHPEAHARGLVTRLQRLTDNNCCNGPDTGECRIATVDLPSKTVNVDGKEGCPIHPDTKIVPLPGLEEMAEGNKAIALVCASKGHDTTTGCPKTYCIGTDGSKT